MTVHHIPYPSFSIYCVIFLDILMIASLEVKEEPRQETEAVEKESSITSPFLEDLEKYDSIISTLTRERYYAFAAVGDGYNVLLVVDGAIDNDVLTEMFDKKFA